MHQRTKIGGVLPLVLRPSRGLAELDALASNSLATINARSALLVLLSHLHVRRLWLPSYICPVLLQPLKRLHVDTRFYPLDGKLEIIEFDWIQQLQSNDAVLVISYFGFPPQHGLLKKLRAVTNKIIHDASQSLFCAHDGEHFIGTIFSPRKFLGVPDGGFLIAKDVEADLVALPDKTWWFDSLAANLGRMISDCGGRHNEWYQLFQKAESNMPTGRYRMTEFTQDVLHHSTDFEEIKNKRRNNYLRLLSRLEHLSLFGSLPPGVVPLGFPIRSSQRDQLRQRLVTNEIFPPVHWALEEAVPAEFIASHELSRSILTLPCDQRYDEADMDRIADAVRDVTG